MGLTLPTVSTTIGPDWATQLNAALTLIDSHTHASTFGALVPSAGININADLNMGSQDLDATRSVRFNNQDAALAVASDVRCLYV